MSFPQTSPSDPDNDKKLSDEACGRLMEIYVQEAEQYDKGLVESWKDDMDVTLVFSGLYSAVLTAFVIESYQKLEEDPADASVALLHRISDQLVSFSNGSTVIAEAPDDIFAPTSAALACNILWFLSLILALSCAFLATFVQQWSRQFIHKAGQLRSSTAHARLFSFLYFGLKDFHMHTVVNIIPSLLHLSLFSFLAGLIAFLRDVNPVLTYIVSFALTIVTVVYTGFTILPLIAANSPYQTPLSPIAWRIWHPLRRHIRPLVKYATEKQKWIRPRAIIQASHLAILPILPTVRFPKNPPSIWQRFRFRVKSRLASLQSFSARARTTISIVCTFLRSLPTLPVVYDPTLPPEVPEALSQPEMLLDLPDVVLAAAQKPDLQRDMRCTAWTLSSLTNDQELLPFIEALPDAIYGPDGLHDNNLHLIRSLVEATDPQADIILRITSVMLNSSNSWFDDKHRRRCSIACPKALWALAYAFIERPGHFDIATTSREFWFPEYLLDALHSDSRSGPDNTLDRQYSISADVLCAINSRDRPRCAGRAMRQFILHASGELEPFEFERTSSALHKYLSASVFEATTRRSSASGKDLNAALLRFQFLNSIHPYPRIPQIRKEDPLPQEQIARCDVIANLYLQLLQSPLEHVASLLKFISERAELDGWGSTQRIWQRHTTMPVLNSVLWADRRSRNAMRERVYAQLKSLGSSIHRTWDFDHDNVWGTSFGILHPRQRSPNDGSDSARIALETMLAMRIIMVDNPNAAAATCEDFKTYCRYVKDRMLSSSLRDNLWICEDICYDNDAKASCVVILTTQLLRRLLLTPDDPVTTNDILDSLEFILYHSYTHRLFGNLGYNLVLRVVDEDLLVTFSKCTLEVCQRWAQNPPGSVNRNILSIIAVTWRMWLNLKVLQSKEVTRNLYRALKPMVSSELQPKIKACISEQSKRVPAPCKFIARYLPELSEKNGKFDQILQVMDLENSVGNSGCSFIRSPSTVNTASNIPTAFGDILTADVEEGQCALPGSDTTTSSSIPHTAHSSPLPNNRWVV